MTIRLPAEWEAQDGILIAWPHEGSDWLPHLDVVEPVFTQIVKEISRFEAAIVVAPDTARVATTLASAGATMANVRLFTIPTNDTWARDFGPITILEDNAPGVLDFGFNGWGLKFAANLDNLVTARLAAAGVFRPPVRTVGLILEGGSIESDGRGTILTTSECLLNPNRNPHLTKAQIEEQLASLFGAEHFLWLEHGYLAGDDTDSHVDTLARLCPDNTIVHVTCDDPSDEHYKELCTMAEELRRFRTREGTPYRLIPLPWPEKRCDEAGERLPATYANFLIMNGAVLVPIYGDRNDAIALAAVGSAFPGREVIGIDCTPLIIQHGSLHCVTMQLPKGVLA